MEFGIFIQTFVPNFRRDKDPDAEHHALMNDIECAIAADKAGFKYVWVSEHHFLDEYHDTFPHPPGVPYWPELIPDPTPEMIELATEGGLIVGDPDHAIKQCLRWEAAGADQLVFGTGMASQEDTLETIRLMGEHVIPKLDTDPVHRTTRFRQAAAVDGGHGK